jgi:hypothetical protein
MSKALLVGLAVCGASAGRLWADPLPELASFSAFREVDQAELKQGAILAEKGLTASSNRGLCVQTCFYVPASPKQAVEALRNWNPARHPELKVYQHRPISLPPLPADFSALQLNPEKRPERWVLDKTKSLAGGKSAFLLSRGEVGRFQADGGIDPSQYWQEVLAGRAQAFAQGGLGALAPYDVAGAIQAGREIQDLLDDDARIWGRFGGFLKGTVLSSSPAQANPLCYWELFDVTGNGTLNLGAFFFESSDGTVKVADVQYYASGGYYASIILYHFWPWESGTLVWRADLLSTPSLAYTKGMERMAYGGVMLQEIKKAVRAFQKDLKGG